MARQVLLVEPNYKNKYPPMGLMKLATYYRMLGDNVRFFKGNLRELAASIIYEDLLAVLKGIDANTFWEVYTPQIKKYILTGRNDDFPNEPPFKDSFITDTVKRYRTKYRKKDYFENPKFDVVGVTTLFTFYWDITIDTINFAKKLCKNPQKVFVGGIMSSIIPDEVEKATGIRPHIGLLDKAKVYDDDNDIIIDTLPLDYSILEEIEYKYPANDAYLGYMTRGCPNRCRFCAVPTIEPEFKVHIPIIEQINETNRRFGKQRNLLLLDNNVLFSSCFDDIIDEIVECGFAKGSTYLPPNQYEMAIRNLREGFNNRAYIKKCVGLYHDLLGKCMDNKKDIYYEIYDRITELQCYHEYTTKRENILLLDNYIAPLYEEHAYKPHKRQRYIDFNQGIDARLIVKYPERVNRLSEINIRPLRIAFDSWSLRKTYEKAVRIVVDAGINNLSNYLLFNSNEKHDTPLNLFYRLQINIKLCEELNISICLSA